MTSHVFIDRPILASVVSIIIVVMGLLALADTHSFRALNQACASALDKGTWRLRDVRLLLEGGRPALQTTLPFQSNHPLIRNLAEYGLFKQNHV